MNYITSGKADEVINTAHALLAQEMCYVCGCACHCTKRYDITVDRIYTKNRYVHKHPTFTNLSQNSKITSS